MPLFNLVVLLSGRGSNFAAILKAIQLNKLDANIAAVFSNRPEAPGLAIARQAGIPCEVLDGKNTDKAAYDEALAAQIALYNPDLIVLAGYMRVLTPSFVQKFAGKIINIHPSLLPKYPGLHTHEQVIANRDKVHGATVHFVTEELDAGPIIAQSSLEVVVNDTPESVAARVLALEHELYPSVIAGFIAAHKMSLNLP
jgi:phosphoribosylglycinamide formyltransferase-1